jgi:hypothetical protein
MDEDEIVIELKPRRHDKWSVFVLLASTATNVTRVMASSLDALTDMLIEHGRQVEIDKKFKVIADGNPSVGAGTVQQED